LRDTLGELMSEKPLKNITITDLTERADLNRGTFYLHYRDIFDLLEQNEIEMLQEISAIFKKIDPSVFTEYYSKNKPYPPLVEIFDWFKNNLDFGKALLGPHGDISFLDKMKLTMKDEIYSKHRGINKNSNNAIYNEYLYDYIIFGFLGIIKQWVHSNAAIPPKEMAVMFVKIALNGPFK